MVGSRCFFDEREREESLLLRYRIDRPHSGGGGDRLGSPVRVRTSANDPLDETTPGEYLENIRTCEHTRCRYWTIQSLRLLRKSSARLRSFPWRVMLSYGQWSVMSPKPVVIVVEMHPVLGMDHGWPIFDTPRPKPQPGGRHSLRGR